MRRISFDMSTRIVLSPVPSQNHAFRQRTVYLCANRFICLSAHLDRQ